MRTMFSVQSMLGAVAALSSVALLSQLASPLVRIFVVRSLGLESYGELVTAQAVVAVFQVIPTLGFGQAILKQGSSGQRQMGVAFSTALILAIGAAFLGYGMVLLWFTVFRYSPMTVTLGIISGITLFASAIQTTSLAVLRLQARYRTITLFNLLALALSVGLTLGSLLSKQPVLVFACIPVLVASISAVVTLVCAGMKRLSLRGTHQCAGKTLRDAVLFGSGDLAHNLYFRADIALVSLLVGERETGYYSIAASVLNFVYLVPSVLFNQVLLPRYFVWGRRDTTALPFAYKTTAKVMALTGLVGAALVLLVARPLVQPVYGSAFGVSADLLLVLAIAIPFRFVASAAGAILLATGQVQRRVRVQVVVALLSVSLNFALLPLIGVAGAAIVTVISEATIMLGYVTLVQRHSLGTDYREVFRPVPLGVAALIVVGLAVCLSIPAWSTLYLFFPIALLIVVYLVVRSKYLSKRELGFFGLNVTTNP